MIIPLCSILTRLLRCKIHNPFTTLALADRHPLDHWLSLLSALQCTLLLFNLASDHAAASRTTGSESLWMAVSRAGMASVSPALPSAISVDGNTTQIMNCPRRKNLFTRVGPRPPPHFRHSPDPYQIPTSRLPGKGKCRGRGGLGRVAGALRRPW